MKILITGATGLIGNAVLKAALKKKIQSQLPDKR